MPPGGGTWISPVRNRRSVANPMVTMAAATIRDFLKIGSCFTIFVALTVGFLEINVEDMSSGDA